MEKGAEISCDGIHHTFLRVKKTKNKGFFLCLLHTCFITSTYTSV